MITDIRCPQTTGLSHLEAAAVHVVPAPLAAPHQVRPPTQAGPTAGAAWQVHVAIADAAGLLLQGGVVHKVKECNLKRSPGRCLTPQHMHQSFSSVHRRVMKCGPASLHPAGGLHCRVRPRAHMDVVKGMPLSL